VTALGVVAALLAAAAVWAGRETRRRPWVPPLGPRRPFDRRAIAPAARVVAALGVVGAALVAVGPGPAVLVLAAAVAAPVVVPRVLRGRAARAAAADVPLALEAAARSLRAGASLPIALADAAAAVGPVVAAAL
jgi:Flp pilus assembly protein TadB